VEQERGVGRSAALTDEPTLLSLTERLVMTENARSTLPLLPPLKPLSEALLFASNFLLHPSMLGSIIPSSRFLVDQVLESVDWGRARVIVEYGPGVGTFTGEILRRMRSDAQLMAIETNRDFVRFLQRTLPDPRLHVVHGSAAEVQQVLTRLALPAPRYIISGIPLGSMPDPVRTDIAVKSRAALEPGGAFLVYQFTARVLPTLQRTFGDVQRSFQRRNFPPAQLFRCTTRGA
jgi:phospholipid N-methyltransferase